MSALDLVAQAAAMQAVVHLTRVVAAAGATSGPAWSVDEAGAVVGEFGGPRALIDLDRWRRAVGPHHVRSDQTSAGLRWTVAAPVQDVTVRLVALAPARTAVSA